MKPFVDQMIKWHTMYDQKLNTTETKPVENIATERTIVDVKHK